MSFQPPSTPKEHNTYDNLLKQIADDVQRYFVDEELTAPGVRNLLIYVLRSFSIPWEANANDNTQHVSKAYQWFRDQNCDPIMEDIIDKLRKDNIQIGRRRVYQILDHLNLTFKRAQKLCKPNNKELAHKRVTGAKELLKLFERAINGEVFLIFQDETTLSQNQLRNHYHIAPKGEPAFCNSQQKKFDSNSVKATIFITLWGILYFDTLDLNYNSEEMIFDIKKCLINLQQHTKYWQNVKEVYIVYDQASNHTSQATTQWIEGQTIPLPKHPDDTTPPRTIPLKHFLLPPYSPFVNPVENINQSLKAQLNTRIHDFVKPLTFDEFDDVVRDQLQHMSTPENGNFKLFQHAIEYAHAIIANGGYSTGIGEHLRTLKKARTTVWGQKLSSKGIFTLPHVPLHIIRKPQSDDKTRTTTTMGDG